jgi:hypothetical protein
VKSHGPVAAPLPPIPRRAARVPVVVAPIPIVAIGNAQAIALATSVNVQFIMGQPWRDVEAACVYVLHSLASTPGCYDSRQSLHVSVQRLTQQFIVFLIHIFNFL